MTPGAATSGLASVCGTPLASVQLTGPRDEKRAIWVAQYELTPTSLFLHEAATVMARRAVPGLSMLLAVGPELPAATANTTPLAVALSMDMDSGSSGLPGPPRLRLQTSRWSV